jgi:hypothetical protein
MEIRKPRNKDVLQYYTPEITALKPRPYKECKCVTLSKRVKELTSLVFMTIAADTDVFRVA